MLDVAARILGDPNHVHDFDRPEHARNTTVPYVEDDKHLWLRQCRTPGCGAIQFRKTFRDDWAEYEPPEEAPKPEYTFQYTSSVWACTSLDENGERCKFRSATSSNGGAAEVMAYRHVHQTNHTVCHTIEKRRWLKND